MIRIVLTHQEIERLKKLRLKRQSNIGERAHYILLAAEGKSAPMIAKQLNRNIITVRQWLTRYQAQGVSGLSSKKQPGRPSKKAPIIESQLDVLLSQPPSAYGYQEAGWQINLLRDWFARQGCPCCDNTILKALNKKGYVYKRFSKSTPTDAPSSHDKQNSVSTIVDKIASCKDNDVAIFFEDESHFSNQPYVNRGWFKRGEKKRSIRKKTD